MESLLYLFRLFCCIYWLYNSESNSNYNYYYFSSVGYKLYYLEGEGKEEKVAYNLGTGG